MCAKDGRLQAKTIARIILAKVFFGIDVDILIPLYEKFSVFCQYFSRLPQRPVKAEPLIVSYIRLTTHCEWDPN